MGDNRKRSIGKAILKAAWQKNRRSQRKELLALYKSKPCQDCNIGYPSYVMDFDHRPGTTKLFSIGQQFTGVTLEDLIDEIAKCDLVCANCHRVRTHQRLISESQ